MRKIDLRQFINSVCLGTSDMKSSLLQINIILGLLVILYSICSTKDPKPNAAYVRDCMWTEILMI